MRTNRTAYRARILLSLTAQGGLCSMGFTTGGDRGFSCGRELAHRTRVPLLRPAGVRDPRHSGCQQESGRRSPRQGRCDRRGHRRHRQQGRRRHRIHHGPEGSGDHARNVGDRAHHPDQQGFGHAHGRSGRRGIPPEALPPRHGQSEACRNILKACHPQQPTAAHPNQAESR